MFCYYIIKLISCLCHLQMSANNRKTWKILRRKNQVQCKGSPSAKGDVYRKYIRVLLLLSSAWHRLQSLAKLNTLSRYGCFLKFRYFFYLIRPIPSFFPLLYSLFFFFYYFFLFDVITVIGTDSFQLVKRVTQTGNCSSITFPVNDDSVTSNRFLDIIYIYIYAYININIYYLYI